MVHDVQIIAEDLVLESIARRIIKLFSGKYAIKMPPITVGGRGEIKVNVKKYNRAADNNRKIYLVLFDMDYLPDMSKCPESEIKRMLGNMQKSTYLLLRAAVAESENWLIADWDSLCNFLSCPRSKLKRCKPDDTSDAKQTILKLARASRKRDIREGMVNSQNPNRQGKGYNYLMMKFISEKWNPDEAKKHSKSLKRTITRLADF